MPILPRGAVHADSFFSCSLTVLIGLSAYAAYVYITYFNSYQFTRYPPEIAKSLRRALYYTNIDNQPQLALKYYKKALQQCKEMRLDPFLDEVMGIRIQVAAWLEKIGNYENATQTLETLLDDCNKWVDWMEKGVASGILDKSGNPPQLAPDVHDPNSLIPRESDAEYVPENLWHKRTRILAKSVGISVKLGQLYSDEHVLNAEKALNRLTWAVETALKEARRRSTEGVKDVEGDWMKQEEIGGALEGTDSHHEKDDR